MLNIIGEEQIHCFDAFTVFGCVRVGLTLLRRLLSSLINFQTRFEKVYFETKLLGLPPKVEVELFVISRYRSCGDLLVPN